METLVGVTKIPFADQILMSEKIRLDPSKSLSTYSLPVRAIWLSKCATQALK